MTTLRILGIDAAMANFGLAVADLDLADYANFNVHAIGLVSTERSKDVRKVVRQSSDDLRRARDLNKGVRAFVAQHKPHLIVAEVPSGGQSARAAYGFGLATGVLAGLDVPIIEVTQREVKMASVGKATASKEEMIAWASGRWPNAGWTMRKSKGQMVMLAENEHPADACASIAAGIETVQFAQLIHMWSAKAA